MKEFEDVIKNLNATMSTLNNFSNSIFDVREEMLKNLSASQRVKYEDYEKQLLVLTKNGDTKGIIELQEKYKKEFND